MDWNLKGKGRTPHKDDKAASDYGVKQVVLQKEPGDSNNDFTNHQGKNDHRNPGDVPVMIIDKVIGRYASQSGVDKNFNEPDENKKPPADGNVKDVNKCHHAGRGRIVNGVEIGFIRDCAGSIASKKSLILNDDYSRLYDF